MSKAEILSEFPKLTADELAEYRKDPDSGGSWQEVEARIKAKLRR